MIVQVEVGALLGQLFPHFSASPVARLGLHLSAQLSATIDKIVLPSLILLEFGWAQFLHLATGCRRTTILALAMLLFEQPQVACGAGLGHRALAEGRRAGAVFAVGPWEPVRTSDHVFG